MQDENFKFLFKDSKFPKTPRPLFLQIFPPTPSENLTLARRRLRIF